jgi:hypothetical protein
MFVVGCGGEWRVESGKGYLICVKVKAV